MTAGKFCVVQNLIKIGQTVSDEILRFLDFQDGHCPPSWILKYLDFCVDSVVKSATVHHHFIKICQTSRRYLV